MTAHAPIPASTRLAARHLPTVVALALTPPIVVLGLLSLGLVVVEAVRAWCPCGSSHGCTHGAHTAVTALEERAGQRVGRGLTPA